ncbi:MAG: FAD-dependent oxidoreductase, partial [Verrucomicrobiota bacterium]
MNDCPLSVGVIGGGLGGLAAAVRLAHAGAEVTVFEKNPEVGGKMSACCWEGFQWDMGPSLLTMPWVLEDLWASVGRTLADDLELVPLATTCRYHWMDGVRIDENEAFWKRPEVAAFLRHAEGIYEISKEAFLLNPIEDWWKQLLKPAQLGKLKYFPRVASPRTLNRTVARYFEDPHLRQLFERFATYNGSSPYKTPSAFAIIPYVQAAFGGWYLRGGMMSLALALKKLALEMGATIHTEHPVDEVDRLPGSRFQIHGNAFDRIICNQDVLSARPSLFGQPGPKRGRALSTSGFVIYLAMDREFPQL